MNIDMPATAERRSWAAAAALGSCVGLALGAAYMAGALARTSVDDARARQIAGASAPLRPSLKLPAPGPDLRPAEEPVVTASAEALPRNLLRASATPTRDLECLSQAVYYEARGEAERGREAVAQVVLNRLRHPRFPKSICAVVFQHADSGCAFSFTCDGQTRHPLELAAWRDARRIAQQALHGFVLHEVAAATDFRAGGGAPEGLARVAQIGGHIFYRIGGHGSNAAGADARSAVPPAPAPAETALTVVKASAPVKPDAAPPTPAA